MAGQKKLEREKKQRAEQRLRIIAACFPSVFLCVEELLFKWSTLNGPWDITILFTMLFSVSYGILLFVITSLSKKRWINRTVRIFLMILLAACYSAYYFVYKTFKMFYDLRTVFSGGTDALTGFTDDTVKMVFSRTGLIHIGLFFLPVLIYLLVSRKMDKGERLSGMEPFVLGASFILFYVGGVLAISFSHVMFGVYTTEYSFQTAVSDFGFLTGIRLDAEHMLNRTEAPMEFEVMDVAEDETEQPEETVSQPVVYDDNVLDIDFEALYETDTALEKTLDSYVAEQIPSRKNEYTGLFAGKNLIFISAEAFSAEVIDPQRTPVLYRLAEKGFRFTDYYQPASAGTTGGEYENIFGLLPTEGGSSFKITSNFHNDMIMGSQLNKKGYNGWAFHNNDYMFYDRHITHNNLGYSNGFMGYGNGMEEFVENQFPESDLEMMEGTVDMYIDQQPFNVYYMSVSGHSLYNPSNKMSAKHWDEVKDLDQYNDSVKYYLAANMELEDALSYLVDRLEKAGIADNTVIVIAADHFPYGLDYGEGLGESDNLSNLYGYEVTDYLDRDHNRLIIWSGCLEKNDPVTIDTPTSSLDILPTLLNLFGIEWDSRLLPGRDVFSNRAPLVFTLNYDWKTERGRFYAASGTFVPNEGITVTDSYIETMRKIVRNKISYCRGVLQTDYFHHVLSSLEG